MSAEDLKNQRTLSYEKVGKMADRTKKALEEANERLVATYYRQLKELFVRFERDHLAYATKLKVDVNSDTMREVYDETDSIVVETEEAVVIFQHQKELENKGRVAEREKMEKDQAANGRLEELTSDFRREVTFIASHMETLLNRLRIKDPVLIAGGGPAVAADIAYCEIKHEEALAKV